MTAHAIVPSASSGRRRPTSTRCARRGSPPAHVRRAQLSRRSGPGAQSVRAPRPLGRGQPGREPATPAASGAAIQVGFQAADVYLVLTSTGDCPAQVRVLLDGTADRRADAGRDVHGGARHRPRPAAVLARVAAVRPAARADGRGPPRRQRVQLHVRLIRRSSIAAAWSRSSGALTLNNASASSISSSRGPRSRTGVAERDVAGRERRRQRRRGLPADSSPSSGCSRPRVGRDDRRRAARIR